MKLTRHFIDVKGREVHFRRTGSGPPVVLMHESPRSSVALEPLMSRLGDRFTVYGFDTPGFGGSDPLPGLAPDAADYAEAMAETLAVLGLTRVPIYGTHTGAVIAMELARRYPDRITLAVLDGYPLFDAFETENIMRQYLPPFRPSSDGTHVMALWSRVRDQCTFFPWYLAGSAGRLAMDCPPLEHHDLVFKDYLRAGDQYRIAYAAAFLYDGIGAASLVKTPVVYLAREDDLLFTHLERLPARSRDQKTGAVIEPVGADRDRWAEVIAGHFQNHLGLTTAPALPPTPVLDSTSNQVHRVFVEIDGCANLVRWSGGSGMPTLMLPPIPGDGSLLTERLRFTTRATLTVDLPGTGESEESEALLSEQGLVDWCAALLAALDLGECQLVGEYASAPLAAAIGAALPDRITSLGLIDAPPGDAESLSELSVQYVPDLTPAWDGRHAAGAWFWCRDALLYEPWFDRRQARWRTVPAQIDVDGLHASFVSAFLGAGAYPLLANLAFAPTFSERLAACQGRTSLITRGGRNPDLSGESWGGLVCEKAGGSPREVAAWVDSLSS